jgi:hypothetical protein
VDNSLQKQYEDYLDMFSKAGWHLLMEDIDNMIDSLDSLDYVNSNEELHNFKGQLSILKRIRGFENSIEAAYAEYQESEANS